MPTGQRTTHRSTTGKKLYAVRDAKGRFKDIQSYQRAHSMDMKRTSKEETAADAGATSPVPGEMPKPRPIGTVSA